MENRLNPVEANQQSDLQRKGFRTTFVTSILFFLACPFSGFAIAQDSFEENLATRKKEAEQFFQKRITPFIKSYCTDCHSNRRPTEAGINFLPALKSPGHAAFSLIWKKADARVKAHDMPPEEYDQPEPEEREIFAQWAAKVKYLSPKDPGVFVIRRLTKTEYANTLKDLFGVDPSIADDLPPEVSGEGYLNSISPLQMEQYLEIGQKALDLALPKNIVTPTQLQSQLIGKIPANKNEFKTSATRVAKSFARKAYRRPPSNKEVDVLLQVFELARNNNRSYIESIRLMLKATLVSPQFLFITPVDKQDVENKIVPLDDYQLASRLSYLLWQTMPDAELMAVADKGKLHQPDVLNEQVKRMLMDPRSRALFDGFGAQWLGIGEIKTLPVDRNKFPEMDAATRQAMYDEARLLFENVVRKNRSVRNLIDSDYTFVNENLASIYGLKQIKGAKMQKVKLTNPNRGGVLTMPAILTATSLPNRTSPVKRGVWVLEQVLGENIPSAPPEVPSLEKQSTNIVTKLTLRQRTELHRSNTVCANCHKLLDPIGFGLENFDAIGRWRDKDDNGKPINASGELPGGQKFASPGELKALVADRIPEFSRNLVEKLLAYALGRRLEGYDEIVVDQLMQKIKADQYRMQTLICEVVSSYPFTHRRIEAERNSK